jgi:hypothetical protein
VSTDANDILRVEVEEDPPRGRFKLVDGAGTQIMSTCPFANAMFERDPSSRDVLG